MLLSVGFTIEILFRQRAPQFPTDLLAYRPSCREPARTLSDALRVLQMHLYSPKGILCGIQFCNKIKIKLNYLSLK